MTSEMLCRWDGYGYPCHGPIRGEWGGDEDEGALCRFHMEQLGEEMRLERMYDLTMEE